MTKFAFYLLIFLPLGLLVLLAKVGLISATVFTVMLALYVMVYHPTVVGWRLVEKRLIGQADFVKKYIPLWNMRYFSQVFFG